MSDVPESFPPRSAVWLQQGQAYEAVGHFDPALAAYDKALASLGRGSATSDTATRLALGITWMNRGNVLQKIATAVSLADAVRSYDEAIAMLRTLPLDTEPRFLNHLGAAWLNRGHAQLTAGEGAAASSFEEAIAVLGKLPIDADPFYRLNLAGAWTNLAHAALATDCERARDAARAALELVTPVERAHEAFAGMSLRARRALVMALGGLLGLAEKTAGPVGAIASEATDAVDDGLALVREIEARGGTHLRPLALRLFRMGSQIYGLHQPHFLGEFVLDNLASPAFAADADFREVAHAALAQAIARLQRPGMFIAGTPDAEKLVATAHSLRAAQQQLATLSS